MVRVVEEAKRTEADASEPADAIPEQNREALRLLDEWMAAPEDADVEWWDEFRQWLAEHRLDLSRNEA